MVSGLQVSTTMHQTQVLAAWVLATAMTLKLAWAEAPADTCYLEMDVDASETEVKYREDWLAAQ